MWKSILMTSIKVLCYIGWHMWEYIYTLDRSPLSKMSGRRMTAYRRQCVRCGIRHTKQMGKWEIN